MEYLKFDPESVGLSAYALCVFYGSVVYTLKACVNMINLYFCSLHPFRIKLYTQELNPFTFWNDN